nr:hypothetical protein HmN_000285500 [Hymenolepis microstoma]
MRHKQNLRSVAHKLQEDGNEGETAPTHKDPGGIHTNMELVRGDGPSSPKIRKISAHAHKKKHFKHHAIAERFRRRERSLLFELIRSCLTNKEVKAYLPKCSTSVRKLSQFEILTIAVKMIPNYIHDMISVKHILRDIEELSNMSKRLNLKNMECKRPRANYIELHTNIGALTEKVISEDKPAFAAFGKDGPSTMSVAEYHRAKFQHGMLNDLKMVVSKRPEKFFSVPDWIQSPLTRTRATRRHQSTNHSNQCNTKRVHPGKYSSPIHNVFVNKCDYDVDSYKYLSSATPLVGQLASHVQAEVKWPNCDKPDVSTGDFQGSYEDDLSLSNTKVNYDLAKAITLDGNEIYDQSLNPFSSNQQTTARGDSLGLSIGQFRHTKQQLEHPDREGRGETKKRAIINRPKRTRGTMWTLSNLRESQSTLNKRIHAQAVDEYGCVAGESNSETLLNFDNYTPRGQEQDLRHEEMFPPVFPNSRISKQRATADAFHLWCKRRDVKDCSIDSVVPQQLPMDATDVGEIEIVTTETANRAPLVGTQISLSPIVNNETELIGSGAGENNSVDVPSETGISNGSGIIPLDLLDIKISDLGLGDVIRNDIDNTDSLFPFNFDLDSF